MALGTTTPESYLPKHSNPPTTLHFCIRLLMATQATKATIGTLLDSATDCNPTIPSQVRAER